MRKTFFISILLLLFSFSCVYYNTFYHAEEKYKKAEKSQQKAKREVATGTEIGDYQDAIKKASKVLTFNPKSKWVDDALFLIGKSYYNLGDYPKAERKFQELVTSFPKSSLVEESYYYLGLTRYKEGNKVEATEALISILDNPKTKKRKSEVCFELGEIKFGEADYTEAINFYKRMLEQFPKDELNPEAQFRIGEAYFQLKEFAQAKENFSAVRKYVKQGELIYQSIYRTGESAYNLKDYKAGLNIFTDLSKEKKYTKYLPQIELKIAEGYWLSDSLDLALKKYEEVALTYPQTEQSAEAYYRSGLINLEEKRDLKKAQEFFDKTKTDRPASPFAKSALEKSADISKLTSFQEQVTKEESLKVAEPIFNLAEFYLTQMNLPESALVEYQTVVEKYPESGYAPKSVYAIAWIYENIYQDSAKAQEYYRKIIDQYPNSDYSKKALDYLSLPGESLQVNLAEKEYAAAESLLFQEKKVDSARVILQKIVSDYPQSRYACKAECALAWSLEQYRNPGDSSVALAYQAIIDKYPQTEYADFAKKRLGIKLVRAPIPPPQQGTTPPVPADSSKDTTKTNSPTPGIPNAPEPKVKGTYYYPESQREAGIKGKVVLKIRIDFTGKVTEVEVINSLNNQELDDAAKDAAMRTQFEPSKILPTQFGEWFRYEIDVAPPAATQQ
ncbi:MAG TPA: TonB family protein [Terriglobales bacterium]|nr:TonB family protein [Terriglobales bacterium]